MADIRTSRSIALVAFANITLAIVALIRESRLAAFAGTTGTADAFMLALYLTDLLGNIVLAGGITFAAVPVLSAYHANDDLMGFKRTLRATTGLVITVGVMLLAAGWFVAPLLVARIGVGLPRVTRDLAGLLFSYLISSVPFFILTAVFGSALYVLGRFAFPAFGPVMLNLVFVFGLMFLAPTLGVGALAFSFVGGTVAMFLLQLVPLWRSQHFSLPTIDLQDPGLRSILRKSWPVMAAIILAQPGSAIEKMLASRLVEGSIAGLTYGFKLSQFPVWVFTAAIGTVVFPALAASVEKKNVVQFKEILNDGLVLTAFISFPFTIAFAVLGRPIVSLLFQRGAFNIDSLNLTSGTLSAYALGLGAQGFVYLFMRASYSLGDTVTPLKAAAIATAAMVSSDVLFVRQWGLPGLGLGASTGAIVQAVILSHLLSKKIGSLGVGLLHSAWRIGLACLSLAGVTYFLGISLLHHVEELDILAKVWRVGLVLGMGAAVYLATCLALKIRELQTLWSAAQAGASATMTMIRKRVTLTAARRI